MASQAAQQSWQEIAAKKRAQRDAKIPKAWRLPDNLLPSPETRNVSDFPHASGFFTEQELVITELTATAIVNKIAAGQLTAVAVTRAVCKRAVVAQQLLNCLTEIFFDEAIARAQELDEYFQLHGKTIGPLHGLPISLKDQFHVEGIDATMGYVANVGQPSTEDSTLVGLLARAGAIFYAKTNLPITLMMAETYNNIFGRTSNPKNRTLTAGGSSGGEGALISFRGSFLGIGTDIGGSIRIPSSYTGLFGLRPSHGRVSYHNVTTSYVGQEAVHCTAGPMGRSAADLRLFMSSYLAQKPWLHDPAVLPVPWRADEEKLPAKLCFGVADHDGFVSSSPPLKRAVAMVREKLLAAGHNVIEYIPTEDLQVLAHIMPMVEADGGEEFQRLTDASGEPLPPFLEAWLGHSAKRKAASVSETWKNQDQRTQLAKKWLDRWEATATQTGTGRPIDGLIWPSTPLPATPLKVALPYNYCCLQPLLDLTCGSFPVTKVDLEKDVVPKDWKPLSDKDQEIMDFYDKPEKFKDVLVGLSVTGRRFEEEKVTAMLKVLEDVVGTDY